MPIPSRILLDVDGVLADLLTPLYAHLKEFAGIDLTPETHRVWDVAAYLPPEQRGRFWSEFGSRVRGHSSVLPYPGAVEGVRELRKLADVFVVTAYLPDAPTWVADRDQWLQEHFQLPRSQVVHTHAKFLVVGDLLIDDRPDNVASWQEHHPHGLGAVWDQGYNRESSLPRFRTWEEVCQWTRTRGMR